LFTELIEKRKADPGAFDNFPLRAASLSDNYEMVKMLMNLPRVNPSALQYSAVYNSVLSGGFHVFERLIADPYTYYTELSEDLFYSACEVGNLGVVKFSVGFGKNPSAGFNYCVRTASEGGFQVLIEYLLNDTRVDASDMQNDALYRASKNGNVEIVRLLLQDESVDPSDQDHASLNIAAIFGNTKIVMELLEDPRVVPSVLKVLEGAIENGHLDILRELLNHPRISVENFDYSSISVAAARNFTEIIEIITDENRILPAFYSNDVVFHATQRGHAGIIANMLEKNGEFISDEVLQKGLAQAISTKAWEAVALIEDFLLDK
jgi:ankyrin repeat protein